MPRYMAGLINVILVTGTKGPINGKEWTEEDWNNCGSVNFGPYSHSKKLAEKRFFPISKKTFSKNFFLLRFLMV